MTANENEKGAGQDARTPNAGAYTNTANVANFGGTRNAGDDVDQVFAELRQELDDGTQLRPTYMPPVTPTAGAAVTAAGEAQGSDDASVSNYASDLLQGAQGATAGGDGPKWKRHKDLQIPIDYLPATIQRLITDTASTFQCPQDYVTAAVFCAVSTVAGTYITSADKYHNRPTLWLVVVGDSGTGKSAPLNYILKPVKAIDKAIRQQCRQDYDMQLEQWQQLKRSKQDAGPEPQRKYTAKILKDYTAEKRDVVLADSPRGILVYFDEIAGLFGNITRYNKSSSEIQTMLDLADSRGYSVDRLGRDSIYIDDPFCDIIGGIQPDIMPEVFGNRTFMQNGLNNRFLWVFPDSRPAPHYANRHTDAELANQWQQGIKELHDRQSTIEMCWSSETQKIYEDYYNECQDKKTNLDGMSTAGGYLQGTLAKLQIHVIRWAMTAQVIAHLWGGKSLYYLEPDAMSYAVRCMSYFEKTAGKVLEMISAGERNRVPKQAELIKMIDAHLGSKENRADLARLFGVTASYITKILPPSKRLSEPQEEHDDSKTHLG